ncbi:MAG: PAS domain-containing sensor histidine kinase, partial [Spirochaetaceae bacterium]|nr:PAS domain-containing sensor histidine kinase [Spirochaetaceae bacterium]
SPGAHKIYGVPQNTLSVEVAESVPLPEYRPLLDQSRDDLIREGKPYDLEFKIKRISDGAILDVHSKAVWDDKSKILFGIIRDITEEKRAREILESLNTDLRREVGVTMGQLEDARRAQLRAETVARLNSLVAHLAHEINTPLGIALTASSHITERWGGEEELGSTAQLVENSVRKISNLVRQFKRLGLTSLPDQQSIGPQELPGFLELLVGSIDAAVNPGRSISVVCDDEPWTDTFDFFSVAEAVSELVKNAVIHNHGDVDVTITPRRNGDWLEFIVSDNGLGIKELIRETLFEPFVTTAHSSGRPGLGLSVIHNLIVDRNDGNLLLVDNSGPGAEFILRVPIIQNPGKNE